MTDPNPAAAAQALSHSRSSGRSFLLLPQPSNHESNAASVPTASATAISAANANQTAQSRTSNAQSQHQSRQQNGNAGNTTGGQQSNSNASSTGRQSRADNNAQSNGSAAGTATPSRTTQQTTTHTPRVFANEAMDHKKEWGPVHLERMVGNMYKSKVYQHMMKVILDEEVVSLLYCFNVYFHHRIANRLSYPVILA